jgi:hypothetical protein
MRPARLLAIVLALVGCHRSRQLVCPTPVGDAGPFDRGASLVFGELHGTRELPAAIGSLACAAAKTQSVVVGLEIWRTEQARLDAYLASDGGPAARRTMLAGPFWTRDTQDGRSSQAMADLIESLRVWRHAGARIGLVAFDVGELGEQSTSDQGERERAMAAALIEARKANPDAAMIVLVGNLHARLAGGVSFAPDVTWMAQYLARAIPSLATFDAAYASGTAWVCFESGCGEQPIRGTGDTGPRRVTRDPVRSDDGQLIYSGRLHVGAIAASKPAAR